MATTALDLSHSSSSSSTTTTSGIISDTTSSNMANLEEETTPVMGTSPSQEEEQAVGIFCVDPELAGGANGLMPLSELVEVEKLGIVALAVIVFYSVSGGPFGSEAAVRAGGNFYTLLGFLVAPLVWSFPEAMITAELSAAMPEASGGVAWVEEAFGARAGWMAGYLGWVSGATDNAIYPVLFFDYLLQVIKVDKEEANPVTRFLLLSSISLVLAYVNWLGLALVGRMSISICAIAMSPFVVFVLIGAFSVDPARWFEMPSSDTEALAAATDDDAGGGLFPYASLGGVLWRPFLNNLFWNLNSFDSAASFAADVANPGHDVPRAMFLSVFMVVLGYFLPLLIALGASEARQEDWVDGYFARAAADIVGPWLGAWVVFAAAVSNIALFQAELSADAFQLMGMAERGHVPKIFATRSRHGTPTYGILLGAAVIVVMGVSDLGQLIEMLNFNYAISLLMEYAAFVKLRITRPDMPRPWKIPLSNTGCILALIPTFCFSALVFGLANYSTYAFSFATNLVGLVLFSLFQGSLSKTTCCRKFPLVLQGAKDDYARVQTGGVSDPPPESNDQHRDADDVAEDSTDHVGMVNEGVVQDSHFTID